MAWTRDQINHLLESNDRAVERGIIRLYNLQTSDEQVAQHTKHLNNMGFQSNVSKLGTYYARWILRGNHLTGVHLSRARKIAIRHSRQLVEIANRGGE